MKRPHDKADTRCRFGAATENGIRGRQKGADAQRFGQAGKQKAGKHQPGPGAFGCEKYSEQLFHEWVGAMR